jgi:cytochrome b6-f complex iron-sulfur subunit
MESEGATGPVTAADAAPGTEGRLASATPAESTAAAGAADAEAPSPASGRRRFLRWLGGLTVVSTAGMVLTPVISFLVPAAGANEAAGGKVLVGTTADFPAGSGKVVAMGSKPAIVVATADGGIKAFSAICTHLGCVVSWNDLSGVIECPCHGGKFNPSSGAVVGGPPPTPLPPITVSVESDQIFLTGA